MYFVLCNFTFRPVNGLSGLHSAISHQWRRHQPADKPSNDISQRLHDVILNRKALSHVSCIKSCNFRTISQVPRNYWDISHVSNIVFRDMLGVMSSLSVGSGGVSASRGRNQEWIIKPSLTISISLLFLGYQWMVKSFFFQLELAAGPLGLFQHWPPLKQRHERLESRLGGPGFESVQRVWSLDSVPTHPTSPRQQNTTLHSRLSETNATTGLLVQHTVIIQTSPWCGAFKEIALDPFTVTEPVKTPHRRGHPGCVIVFPRITIPCSCYT